MRRSLMFTIIMISFLEITGGIITIQGEEDEFYYLAPSEPFCVVDTVFSKAGFYFLCQGSREVYVSEEELDKFSFLVAEKKGHKVHYVKLNEAYGKKTLSWVQKVDFQKVNYKESTSPNYVAGTVSVRREYNVYEEKEKEKREHLYEIPDDDLSNDDQIELISQRYLYQALKRYGYELSDENSQNYQNIRKISFEIEAEFVSSYYEGSGWKITLLNYEIDDEFGKQLYRLDTTITSLKSLGRVNINQVLDPILDGLNSNQIIDSVFSKYQEDIQQNLSLNRTSISAFNIDEFDPIQAIEKTVTISTENGHGSGCIIGKNGYILSNHHVTAADTAIYALMSNGDSLPVEVVKFSPIHDLALLKADYEFQSGFSLASLDRKAQLGEDVFVIGTPLDLELNQSISKGYFSKMDLGSESPRYQLAASVNPGNSGGAVVNTEGQLMGIVNAKLVGAGTRKFGFAIPISVFLNSFNVILE